MDWLYDPPFFYLALAVVAALAAATYGLLRGDVRVGRVGAIGLAAALAWAAIGWAVATPSEQAVSRTKAIVAAYEGEDWPELAELLDPRTSIENIVIGGDNVAARAEQIHNAIGQDSVTIRSLEPDVDAAGVRVRIRVFSQQDQPPTPLPTAWEFSYLLAEGQLILDRIRYLPDEPFDGEAIRGRIASP